MIQTTSKRAAMRRAFIQRGVDASFETIASHCSVHSNTDITRKDWRNYKSRIRCGNEKQWQGGVPELKILFNERGKQMLAGLGSKSSMVKQALEQLGTDAEFEPVAKFCRKQGIIINRHDLYNGRSLFKKNGNGHPTPPSKTVTLNEANKEIEKRYPLVEDFKPFDPAEAVKMVKELANRLGGMENLRRLVDAMV